MEHIYRFCSIKQSPTSQRHLTDSIIRVVTEVLVKILSPLTNFTFLNCSLQSLNLSTNVSTVLLVKMNNVARPTA